MNETEIKAKQDAIAKEAQELSQQINNSQGVINMCLARLQQLKGQLEMLEEMKPKGEVKKIIKKNGK